MKKKKILAAIMSSLLCVTAFPVSAAEVSSESVDTEKMKITFVADTQPQDIETFVDRNNISMDSFMVTVDDTHTSGYVINEQSDFESLWNDFVYMQTALLSEGISNNADSEASEDMKTMLDALQTNDFKMSVICNTPANLTQRTSLEDAAIIESVQNITSVQQENAITSAEPKASNWVPTSGHAGTWPSQNVSDATYMEVHYEWDSASELSTLTNQEDSTLEGDLVFYNYDGEAPSDDWYEGNWTFNSNQPRAYLDTQFSDHEDEEVVFTVGCSDAAALEANTDYYWIAYGNQTGSEGSKAKLNFQRGHRVIDGIYEDPWNIFGDETKTVIPFSSWDTTETGTKYF